MTFKEKPLRCADTVKRQVILRVATYQTVEIEEPTTIEDALNGSHLEE